MHFAGRPRLSALLSGAHTTALGLQDVLKIFLVPVPIQNVGATTWREFWVAK